MACGQRGQGIIQEITIEMEGTLCGDTTFEYCELLGEMGRCEGAIETETEGDVDQRLSHASVRRTPPPTTVTQHRHIIIITQHTSQFVTPILDSQSQTYSYTHT